MRPPKSTKASVSNVMKANKGKGTSLELLVRKKLSMAGLRGYRTNWKKAPGRPDIAFTKKKVAVIINGCFWHGCRRCIKTMPKTNRKYWAWKVEDNRRRDKRNLARLKRAGWRYKVVWEHDIKRGNIEPTISWVKKELKHA